MRERVNQQFGIDLVNMSLWSAHQFMRVVGIVILLSFNDVLFSQPVNTITGEVSKPSLDAAAYMRYEELSVNYHLGLPQISVPVATVRQGPLQMPLSLSYHGAGIVVATPSNWIGTNWSLSGTYMINRQVQGIPDEHQNGYASGIIDQLLTPSGDLDICDPMISEQVKAGEIDTEPDLFTLQVPGYSGKFYLDKNGEAQLVPASDFKVDYTVVDISTNPLIPQNVITQLVVTDPSGTKYIFGQYEEVDAIERSYTYATTTEFHHSGWHMVRMESFDGLHSIDIDYTDYGYSYLQPGRLQLFEAQSGTLRCSGSSNNIDNCFSLVRYATKRPVSITNSSNTMQVDFVSTTIREDVQISDLGFGLPSPTLLEEIVITQGPITYKHELSHEYWIDNTPGVDSRDNKRLFLTSVATTTDGDAIPPYVFDYHDPSGAKVFPHRRTKAIDHEGYYNGALANNSEQFNAPPTTISVNAVVVDRGNSDRESHEDFMKLGALSTVTLPTGGQYQLDWGANEVTRFGESEMMLKCKDSCIPSTGSACCLNTDSVFHVFPDQEAFDRAQFRTKLRTFPQILNDCNGGNIVRIVTITVRDESNQIVGSQSYQRTTDLIVDETFGPFDITDLIPEVDFIPGEEYKFEVTGEQSMGSFMLSDVNNSPMPHEVSGLRIEQISYDDGVNKNPDVVTTYNYSVEGSDLPSGNQKWKAVYGGDIEFYRPDADTSNFGNCIPTFASFLSDMGVYPGANFTSTSFGYERVQMTNADGAYSIYNYSVENTELVLPAEPFLPVNYEVERGTLLSEQHYTNSGSLISEKIISDLNLSYKFRDSQPKFKVTFPFGKPAGTSLSGVGHAIRDYEIQNGIVQGVYLPHQTTNILDGITTVTTTEYDDNFDHFFPVRTSMTNSDGKVHATETSYTYDYEANNEIRDELINQNRILPAWQTLETVDGVVTKGTRSLYAESNAGTGLMSSTDASLSGAGTIYPRSIYQREVTWDGQGTYVDDGWVLQNDITEYSTEIGMPTEILQRGWADPLSFTWTDAGLQSTWSFIGYQKTYEYLPNTQLMTNFENVDGTSSSYSYDGFARLLTALDDQRGVETSYIYGYQQNPGEYNYIETNTLYPSLGQEADVNIRTRVFMDGLGRNIQTLRLNQAPKSSSHIVVNTAYDAVGRVSRQYEPVVGSGGDGYNTGTTDEFTLTEYEPSPLNRPISVTPPSFPPTLYEYGANNNDEGDAVINHLGVGNYMAGQLAKQVVIDGNGNQTETYTDKRGRTVLVRRIDDEGNFDNDTYTLYDDKDRPTHVLPPETGLGIEDAELIFSTVYYPDDQVHLKKVPDQKVVEMRYDLRDLLTHMQDGERRKEGVWYTMNYDDYGRAIAEGFTTTALSDDHTTSTTIQDLLKSYTYGTEGITIDKLEQSSIRILGSTDDYINTAYSYLPTGLMKSMSSNHIEALDNPEGHIMSYEYDSQDNILREFCTVDFNTNVESFTQSMDYDHIGRLIGERLQRVGDEEILLSSMTYDAKDQVLSNTIGDGIQKVDYDYAPNRLLTQINDPNNLGIDLFGQSINYTNPHSGVSVDGQNNGNISSIQWTTPSIPISTYGYSYDHLDRITAGEFSATGQDDYYSTSYSYDDGRGNIKSINRNKEGGVYDDMMLNYVDGTNRVQSLAGIATSTEGTDIPNPKSISVYEYDDNGAITRDPTRNVEMTRNYLNMISRIEKNAENFINYTYDAEGTLHQKYVEEVGVDTSRRTYISYLEFVNGELDLFKHSQGYVQKVPLSQLIAQMEQAPEAGEECVIPSEYQHRWIIKDYLGNTRVVFDDEQQIISEHHYYPFGLEMEGSWNRENNYDYLYNGKEVQKSFDLGYQNYGARFYDPAIGRFTSVDPLAAIMPEWGTYTYTFNNPLKYTDPTGMAPACDDCPINDSVQRGVQKIADGITAVINGGKAVVNFVGGLFKQGSNTSNNTDSGEQPGGIQQVNGDSDRNNNAPTNEATNSSGEIMDDPLNVAGGGVKGEVLKKSSKIMNLTDRTAAAFNKVADATVRAQNGDSSISKQNSNGTIADQLAGAGASGSVDTITINGKTYQRTITLNESDRKAAVLKPINP